MATTVRWKVLAAVALAAAGAGGYLLYSVRAAQAQGELAQAPLNVQAQVPAAFIMALDDSGSMRFQTLFPSRDGGALWGGTGNNASFFYTSGADAGKLRVSDTTRQFVHVAPYPAPRQGNATNDNAAIPPIDAFGFSRSHVYNRAYFDPNTTYQPWKTFDGGSYPDSDPTAARVDPNNASPTVNLTVERAVTTNQQSNDHRFRVRNGMVLPAGMKYYGAPGCGLSNSVSNPATPSGWRTLRNDVTATCDVDVYIAYFPATFYLPVDHPAPDGFLADRRVLAPNACTYSWATGSARCDMYRYEIRPENYATQQQYQAAIRNFANWFTYYGARNRAVVAAVTHALAPVNNMRVGYFTINNRNTVTMRDMSSSADKQAFYNSIVTLGASGNTPNLPAVAHLGEQFRRTDAGAPIRYACQKNAGMLFTDGFSNVAQTGYGNVDGTMGAPFSDNHSNTLADIATKYYLDTSQGGYAPLRTGPNFPPGRVPIPSDCPNPRKDCQPNLHMNFYGITLGARGVTYDPDNPRDPFEQPYISWPAYQGNQRSTIDDIWHATVNTRGEFINANTPAQITEAMRRILQSVGSSGASSGTIAMTGARLGSRSLSVVPGYSVNNEATDWSGTMVVAKIVPDLVTGEVTDQPLWEASAKLAELGAATRRNQTYVGTANGTALLTSITDLEAFCDNPRPGMSRCTADEVAALGVNASQVVDYLLGDTTREKRNGGTLRDRTTVLGDIINSTPVVSSPTDDYGYRSLPAPYGASYDSYMTAKQSRPAMVYVGANDGMLHAFHGGIDHQGNVSAQGGREMFAYVPRAVLGHMGNLLFPYQPGAVGQKFQHRYYVDGPITVGDAHYGGGWKTVLVGTTGAGGRSVFALNVSDPSTFQRLWEIDDRHPDEAVRRNIGHVLGKPVIVPFRDQAGSVSWKAIFGNGYNSENGNAVLFVVDVETGSVRMITATESGAPAGSNGLGNIVVVDRRDSSTGGNTQDGFADTVYAADQKGAIWKFDLLSNAGTVTTPLFTTRTHTEGGATYRQPIIGGLVATAGGGGGVMLLFGTGSFSFVDDATDNTVQSIYGVLDRGAGTTLTRANLVARSIANNGATTRTINASPMDYTTSGWYIDLPAGERAVGYPRVASGILFIPTYAPTQSDGCSAGGENWLWGLDTRTGAPALSAVRFGGITGDTQQAGVGAVRLATDGSAPVKDVGVSILSASKPLGTDPDDPLPRCWMRITVPGMADGMFVPYPCGRQSWRQIE